MSEENVKIVKSIYRAFEQGDIPAVFNLFDPDIEWIAAENSPAAVGSPYRGLNDVREGVFMRIARGYDGFTIKVDELLDAGDKIIMLGYYLGAYKATGKRFQAQVAHIWTIYGGKAAKFQQYTDTYQLAEIAK
jgi:ketosteroid isomerase-like protein